MELSLLKIILLFLECSSLCYSLNCNGKCKCHETLMDCSASDLKKFYFKDGSLPPSVSKIDLRRNNISGLPMYKFDFVNDAVKDINFDSNNMQQLMTESLWKSFPMLNSLSFLENKISQLHKGVFNFLDKLKSLDLALNRITEIESGSFVALSSLEKLSLDGNQIKSFPSAAFEGLKALKILRLNSNHLKTIDFQWLHHMISLQQFMVKSNEIQFLRPFDLKWQRSLHLLDLSDNKLQYIPNLPAIENINSGTKTGSDWYINLLDNPVQCNCHLASLANYSVVELTKAVCGMFVKCKSKDSIEQWAQEKSCDSAQRWKFIEKYRETPICQEPTLQMYKKNVENINIPLIHLYCSGGGNPIPDVKIQKKLANLSYFADTKFNLVTVYLERNGLSINDIECIGTNTVGSTKSCEWKEDSVECNQREKSNREHKWKENVQPGINLVFPFIVSVICTTVTVSIALLFVYWKLCQ